MTGSLWSLAIALAIFIGIHLTPAVPGLRAALIGALGRLPYRGLFSLIAVCGLVWIVFAHMDAPYVALWDAPGWTWLIPLAVIPLALMLVAGERSPGMRKITRHPMLWSVLLWAAAHIAPNGDAASLMLFGAFALFAVIDQPLADARMRREEPEAWAEKSATSSAIPFLAALQGRARPSLKEIGLVRIGVALVLYLVLLFAHEHVIGFSALPL
ncbi:MAG: NnrU family protein [Alphaproteobacteria bacterium]|jgi:uncharacterized membrane protein|nr:NnrU family protein [Alphaproteobacteria bacterium]|tara:strand:- start:385 stop:1023 length:639 start_codon:yes stop_codon:yes gene_type:complete